MSLPCPYRHVSYATWRLQIFQSLYRSTEPGFAREACFPVSRSAARSKRCQSTSRLLDEDKNDGPQPLRDGVSWIDDTPGKGQTLSPHNQRPRSSRKTSFNPYSPDGQQSIRALVSELKPVVAEARREKTHPPGSDAVSVEPTRLPRTPILKRTGPKHMEAKRMPTDDELDALKNNVWAQMLAAPLRACQGSFARLPAPFLVDLEFVEDPEKKAVHLAPAPLADLDALEQRMAKELARDNWLQSRDDNWESNWEARELQQGGEGGDSTPPQPPTQKVKQRPKSRLVAEMNLVRFLTLKLMERSKREPGKIVSKSNALARLVPAPLKDALEKAQHYAINKRKIDAATGADQATDTTNEPLPMDYLSRLQWQVDMYERIPRIMRKRILVALKALAEQATSDTAAGKPSKVMTLSIHHAAGVPSHVDCPPESIILHIGDEDTRTLLSSIPAPPKNESGLTQPPLPSNNWFVPPVISLDGRHRLPVFPLKQMLATHADTADVAALAELTSAYKVLQHHRHHHPGKPHSNDTFLLVRPGVGPPRAVMEEVWQLWRYLGGSHMGLVYDEDTERCFDQGQVVK
ncbi:hypothetical protein PV08_11104 [Exophiala spinifera]|uniref:Uncharacterized protein n=1 Tax=Exophiala spinifera TaxID=91928 RepID=A0A0D2ATT2_9EURO|nr:uncharacterized protein PV08_11104 [Exophiala spinifera]KIW10143.1 hypothetical protein PV08_11104 [Exophiala spinifera]